MRKEIICKNSRESQSNMSIQILNFGILGNLDPSLGVIHKQRGQILGYT